MSTVTPVCVPEVLRHALQRPDDPRQQQVGVEAAQGELDGVLGINTVIIIILIIIIITIITCSLSQRADTRSPKAMPQVPWRMVMVITHTMGPRAGTCREVEIIAKCFLCYSQFILE